jgi:HSP90 family molecular chaperone
MIPWRDSEINENKFAMNEGKYALEPFKPEDRKSDTLRNARHRKINKYEPIISEAKQWLQENKEQICIKHRISGSECRQSMSSFQVWKWYRKILKEMSAT